MTSSWSDNSVPGGWSWPSDLPNGDGLHRRTAHQPEHEQFHSDSSTRTTPESYSSQSYSYSTSQAPPRQNKRYGPRTCRICLETVQPTYHMPSENLPSILQSSRAPRVTYDSEGGKLISPCKCKGSQKYVHEACLEAWRYSDAAFRARTYWECPTCKFKYRFARIGWGRFIGSIGSQIALTSLIFLLAIFLLGFIADPIINLALDPTGHIFNLYNIFSSRDERPNYFPPEDAIDGGWMQHLTKGFASLGLLGVIKTMLASPIQVWFRQDPRRGGRGPTGRDRIQTATWLFILFGAVTVIMAVWKIVRLWSQRVLERAGDRVMDVGGDDDDDGDANE